jgi:hypothetical protein
VLERLTAALLKVRQLQNPVNRRSILTPDRRPTLTPLSDVFWR